VVDDFEAYTDNKDASETIWQTWIDGYGIGTNGSQVGYATSPFAEMTIVNSGSQSMPFLYDNTGGITSEGTRTFTPGQDWTASGVKSLSLRFHGATTNTGGNLYIKINDTKVSYDGDAGDLSKLQWWAWNIDLSTVGANLSSVTKLTIGVEGAGKGTIYIDNIQLYAETPETIAAVEPDNANLVAYYALNGNANDGSGHGYNGTEVGAHLYVNGVSGQALDVDGASGYVDIANATNWPSGFAPRTMSAWGKTRTVEAGYRWMAAYGTPGSGTAMFLGMNGTTFYGGAYGDDIPVPDFFVVDEWYHTCLTYDGATARLYSNGMEVASAEKAWNLALSRAYIGRQVHDDSGAPELWNGSVDEVSIYSSALSPEEVNWLSGRRAPVHVPF
jgi:concanavalin A-like lectin/glucanase superfamily protein